MSLSRWEPFSEFDFLRKRIDRMFEEFARPAMATRTGVHLLPVDLYQTDEDVVVKAEIPGVKPEDISISITGEMLTIRAEKKLEGVKEEERLMGELPYGTFQRDVALPFPVEPDKAQAKYEHGILILTVPKSAAVRPKTIKVQAVQGKQIGRA